MFISWNHNDSELKNKLVSLLESDYYGRSCATTFDSDKDAQGELNGCIRRAIMESKVFIVLVTNNSIKSDWVRQEIGIALEIAEKQPLFRNCIRPVFFDSVTDTIKSLDPNDPFRQLLKLSSSFSIDKNLKRGVLKCIESALLVDYEDKLYMSFAMVNVALNNYANEQKSRLADLNGKIEPEVDNCFTAAMEFEDIYLNRDVYENGEKTQPQTIEDILSVKCNIRVNKK